MTNSNIRTVRPMPRRGRLVAILEGDFDSYFDGAPADYSPRQNLSRSGLMHYGVIDSQRVGAGRRAY